LFLPGSIGYVARFFVAHPEVDVVYGHRIVINERDEEVGRWILPPHRPEALLWNNYVPQETLFWRRRIWDKIGGHIDESFRSTLDWDLVLRLHRAGARFYRLPRFLGAFRIHSQQKTETIQAEAGLPEQKRLRERMHGRAVKRSETWVRAFPYLMKSMVYHGLFQIGALRY
jgi:GT2 family glycosyltransferase